MKKQKNCLEKYFAIFDNINFIGYKWILILIRFKLEILNKCSARDNKVEILATIDRWQQ